MVKMDKTIVIEYCEDGEAVSDFGGSNWLYNVIHTKDDYTVYKVSTSTPIEWIKLSIARGELDCKKVIFRYFDQTFQANEYGAIQSSPRGFCDISLSLSEDLLKAAIKKRKKDFIDGKITTL